ncbi:uncharacterized protein LOC127872052 [Dreissena polymorpha]|uniref:uncharacterized protein LOC127872052 n=1 Tax=Dreissena polymorpha TaxID=45954 RepID=UPI0022640543|nr:uncharacterized protein LOC127872052 [Dreissena polymorpha]
MSYGHAGLQGNEAADGLAKQGAKEANAMPEDSRTTTIQEVKGASHKSCMIKWQKRWQNSSTGSTFYEFFPSVEQKRHLDHPDKATYGVILQLQTGYSILNAHRTRVGINVSPLCECGALESTEHYLLECYIHETHRGELLKALHKLCGVTALDIKTLLNTDDHPYIPGITSELSKYIKATGRFMTKQPVSDKPRSDIHN